MDFQKLSLANPRAQVLFPAGQYTYAFGNTPGVSLTEHFGTRDNRHLDLLLLGLGDLRNVFFTISELVRRISPDRPESLSFHLNDCNPSIVARNVIILEIAKSVDPNCDKDVDFLWNVWYSLALTEAESQRLQKILETLVSQDHATNEFQLGTEDMLTQCRQIWGNWINLDLDTETVACQRQQLIAWSLHLSPTKQHAGKEESDIFTAATWLTKTTIRHLFTILEEEKCGQKCLQKSGPVYKEIHSYFVTGSSVKICGSAKVNATLICPFEHKWKVHYGSSPFAAYNPVERQQLEGNTSVTKACKTKLKKLIKDFQTFSRITSHNRPVKVTFWIEDALQLCLRELPKDLQFDVIHTSNLSDHIGILNILVCCGSRLKEPGQSQLLTSTMLWSASGHCTLNEYLESSIGIHFNLFPTLLGLKLAEDLDLGRSDSLTAKEGWRVEDTLIWVRTEPRSTPVSIDRSPDILAALKAIASRCFRLPRPEKRYMQLSGVTLSSPTTFFYAFARLATALKEPGDQILSFVEEALPNVRLFPRRICNKLGNLSWNVLKSAAGFSSDVVLKIEVQVTFPKSVETSRTTPALQAALFEDPADAMFLGAWPVCQLEQRRFHRNVHLFYNNVRYDHDKGVVSFLVLEKDWESLHPETVLVLLSFSTNCKSDLVKVKYDRSETLQGGCSCARVLSDVNGKRGGVRQEIVQKRNRRIKRNVSFLKVNCMSGSADNTHVNGDCYQLDALPKPADLVIHNSGHVYKSTSCLLAEETGGGGTERCFASGIVSPVVSGAEDGCQDVDIDDEVIIHNGAHSVDKKQTDNREIVAVQRIENITRYFGLSDDVNAPVQETRSHALELLVLEEHVLCYNAEVRILKRTQTSCPTVVFKPKELPTVVELSLNGEGPSLKLYFAAPVEEGTSNVRVLDKTQKIRCHFPKKEFGVYGQLCIKRPPTLDFKEFSKWRNKEDLSRLMNFTQCTEQEALPKDDEALNELQNVLECVIASFVECREKNNCFTVHETHDVDGTTPELTIVVEEAYNCKGLPFAKILFCDHKIISFPSKSTEGSPNDTAYKRIVGQLMKKCQENLMITVTEEGQILLRKLLYTNAKRVKQTPELRPVWIDSFLQLRFQRRGINLHPALYGFKSESRDLSARDYHTDIFVKQFNNKTSSSCVADCPGMETEKILSSRDQFITNVKSLPEDIQLFIKKPGQLPGREAEKCANCNDDTKKMKQCSRCRKVFYCNKACQRQHWEKHRSICS